jgi:chromosome segregation ATPase
MTAWVRCVIAVVMFAAPSAVFAQPAAPVAADLLAELLVEVRGLRAAMERAATVGARIQLLVARVQMQEQRIAEATRRASAIRDDLSSVDMQIAQFSVMLKQFESAPDGGRLSPEDQRQVESMLEIQKQQVAAAEKRRQDLVAEDALLSQQIAADQSRWSDVNAQLDELERALIPRKQ